jgi:hypothetical protein
MIWAAILENGKRKGKYAFVQLPNPGDQIQILNERQRIDLMRVLYVQHTPIPSDNPNDLSEWEWPHSVKVAEGTLRTEAREPVAHIICEIIGEI